MNIYTSPAQNPCTKQFVVHYSQGWPGMIGRSSTTKYARFHGDFMFFQSYTAFWRRDQDAFLQCFY